MVKQQHRSSAESLDVGYGKCPEFVCVDGLIVSRDSGDSGEWGEEMEVREVKGEKGEEKRKKDVEEWRDVNTDTEQSFSGTMSTMRYKFNSNFDTVE